MAITARLIETGERLETEYRIMRRDGSVAWVRDEGVLVYDEAGEPLCIQGYILDITEQKEREAALLESEAIVGSSFDSIVARSPDGLVTSWNSGGRAHLRLQRGGDDRPRGRVAAPGRRATCCSTSTRASARASASSHSRSSASARTGSASTSSRRSRRSSTRPARSSAPPRPRATSASASARRRSRPGRPSCSSSSPAARRCPRCSTGSPTFVEEHGDDVLASILLLDRDGRHLRHGAAPSLPAAYCEAIDGVAIGPSVGSCGTAAYRRERVGVSDIASDPLWADYASWRWTPVSGPAGRRRSSRPAARCSGRSPSTTARRARGRRRRHRARRARHARRGHRDRARAFGRSGPRERGPLPRPLRERERADRDRHDGRDDHGGQQRVRAGPRLQPRGADRHRARDLPHARGTRGVRAGDRARSSPARPRARRTSRSSSPRTGTR